MSQISYTPTPQDIAEYEEKGYWISPQLIDNDHIARLDRAMERLFAGERDGEWSYFDGNQVTLPSDPYALRRVVNGWWVNDVIRDTVLDAGLGKICAALMKVPGVRLWSDQVILKPGQGKDGNAQTGNVGWHQDYAYWSITDSPNMLTAWIALQDTDLTNGGMRTLVGSHRWGLIKDSDTFFDSDLEALREKFSTKVNAPWIDEPCLLKAGQVSFHHALCFHGSGENLTDQPRRAIVGHYMPDGAKYKPCGKVKTQLRLLGPRPQPGQLFNNAAFPLVYPRK